MKKQLMVDALTVVAAMFEKYENIGSKIDTQESEFKSIKQQVEQAIDTPEDEVPAVPAASDFETMVVTKFAEIGDAINSISAKLQTAN